MSRWFLSFSCFYWIVGLFLMDCKCFLYIKEIRLLALTSIQSFDVIYLS